MKRYLALACGAALSVAVVGSTYAQNTPPSTDPRAGESSGQSAYPDPDKSKRPMSPNVSGTTGGPAAINPPAATNPPPSTDRPAGESSGQSSYPNPDKPKQ